MGKDSLSVQKQIFRDGEPVRDNDNNDKLCVW